MLNCTDLACVLHHHHFYAHLHHLKNHLQDDTEHYNVLGGDGSDISDNYIGHLNNNESDSDLSSLSHVDAPNDTIYMVCGVVIAMLLVGVIIILVALTINKLRKREETASVSPASVEAQPQYALQHTRVNGTDGHTNCTNGNHRQIHQQILITTTTNTTSSISEAGDRINNCNGNSNCNDSHNNGCSCSHSSNYSIDSEQDSVTFTRSSGGSFSVTSNGWVFPPKAPTPNIYNCLNSDFLAAATHPHGFKGFRKQFSGRFKRLVSRKTEPTSPIPPELKPQLKTIYVY